MLINIIIPKNLSNQLSLSEIDSWTIEETDPSCFQTIMSGESVWSLRTFLELKRVNYPNLSVSHDFKPEAINIGHVNTLTQLIKVLKKPFNGIIVSCDADRSPFPFADINVKQAPSKSGIFIYHWPEIGIIPRNKNRGLKIEKAAYFGVPRKREALIHDVLERELAKLGVEYIIINKGKWHDYSEIDLSIALRSDWRFRGYRKPGSKLYNSIIAGIPFIGTPEPSYLEYQKPGHSWLEAKKVSEVVAHVQRLKNNETHYAQLIAKIDPINEDFFIKKSLSGWIQLLDSISNYGIKKRNKLDSKIGLLTIKVLQAVKNQPRFTFVTKSLQGYIEARRIVS